MKFFAKALTLFCLLGCARAQGQECLRLLDSLNALIDRGEFQKVEAMEGHLDTLCLREVGDRDSLYGDVQAAHGVVLMVKGKSADALAFFRRAKEISLRTRGLYEKSTGSIYSAEGFAFAQTGQTIKALAALDTSLLVKKYLGDSSAALGAAYATRGQILLLSGRYKDAKTDLMLSIQNAKANHLDSASYQYLVRVSSLGLILTYLGENREATPILEKGAQISIALFGEENMTSITLLGNLAQNYLLIEELDNAQINAQKALGLAQKVMPEHPRTNQIRSTCGVVFLKQGRYSEALNLLLEAKTIEDKQHRLTPADYATLLHNIGSVYFGIYDLPNALTYMTDARESMAIALGTDNLRYAMLNTNLAACHFQMGNTQLAKSLAEESFALVESFGESFPDYENFLSHLALSSEGNEGLLFRLSQIKDIVGKKFGEKSAPFGISLATYASCLGNLSRENEAIPLLEQAEEIIRNAKSEQTKAYLDVLSNLATCHERLGNKKQSLSFFKKAIELAEKNMGHENANYSFLLQGAAGVEERWGNPRSAFAHYLAADTLYRRIFARNFAVLSDAGREAFLADIHPQLDHWHSFAWRHAANFPEIPGLLFDDQLSQKGQLLYSARSVLASLRDDTTLAGQMTRWLSDRQSLDFQRILVAKNDPKAQYTTFELDSFARAIDFTEAHLTQKSKAFAAATQPVGWRKVQARLGANEAVVEFFHFNYSKPDSQTDSILYGALVLRKRDKAPHFVPLFEEKQLLAVINKKGIGESEWLKRLYPAHSEESSKLYRLVWQPLEKELANVKRVWYAPSGLLHQVAFPVLSKAHGERLVEHLDLQQVGSTRELAIALPLSEGTPQSALILACVSYPTDTAKMKDRTRECLGDPSRIASRGVEGKPEPLPNSLSEADTVAAQLQAAGAQVEVRIGYEALEDDAKKRLTDGTSPDVLMFTTHGFAWDTLPKAFKGRFPPHNPMYSSGLLLAGSERVWMGGESALDFQDGILTAREIGDMDLQHTRLAILSACKSGLGEANSSEGVYGLQRAFKIAGARQVLVTLWEIPDSPDTRDFIGQFTSRWLASGDARAALRETQLDFFRRGKSVQVWGAWVLI